MAHRNIVTLLYAGLGLMFVIMSIPFILGRVEPNAYFGFRTAKTLSDTRIWYEANRFMGYALLAAGAVTAGGAVLIRFFYPADPSTIVKANLGVFVLSMAVAAALSYWKLSRI